MPPKTTQAEFIERATRKHRGRYTYAHAVYVNSRTKLIIICPQHGDFKQTPSDHLSGYGCPKCGTNLRADAKRSTPAKFVERATQKHGSKYTYAKAVYKGDGIKLIITCPKHGDFKQTPNSHLGGRGCRKCSISFRADAIRSNREEFVARATQLHSGKYTYEKAVYVAALTKLIITCPEHGDFKQTANNHLAGSGCMKCRNTAISLAKRSNREEFIARATQEHRDKYTYAKAVYQGCCTKLVITCPDHGDFKQMPCSHLQEQGCPECGIGAIGAAQRLTLQQFVEKAREVHRGRFSYPRAVYVNSNTKLIITCSEHGDFKQMPSNHLTGAGCTK